MSAISTIYLTGIFIAVGAALLGVFVVLRRMALVSDALSHVALPGLAVGLLYGFNPFWGALAALVAAVFLILLIEEKTTLVTETIVGILFTTALALGSILTPKEQLLESLFGSLEKVTPPDFWLALVGSLIIIGILVYFFSVLTRAAISAELLQAEGLPQKKYQLLYLLTLALLLALGIRIIGALLMGALIILPAATAKNFSPTIKSLVWWAIIVAMVSVIFGIWSAFQFNFPPGPAIILTNVALFSLTFAFAKKR